LVARRYYDEEILIYAKKFYNSFPENASYDKTVSEILVMSLAQD
jgi:hypothetical protein